MRIVDTDKVVAHFKTMLEECEADTLVDLIEYAFPVKNVNYDADTNQLTYETQDDFDNIDPFEEDSEDADELSKEARSAAQDLKVYPYEDSEIKNE